MGSWDFWASGRAAWLGSINEFLQGSELFRTGQVPAAAVAPNSEITAIHEKPEDADGSDLVITASKRASQRGPEVHQKLLTQLLTCSRLSKCPSAFLKNAHIDILDFQVHSGDKLLASLNVSESQDAGTRGISSTRILVQNNAIKSSMQAGPVNARDWLRFCLSGV